MPIPQYPAVPEKLTYDSLFALPVISPEMTAMERRKLCVDFFRFTNSFLWTPKTDFDHYTTGSSLKPKKLRVGLLYSGLCYTSCANGNVYRILDYYDENTGVLDYAVAHDQERQRIGAQCSGSVHWAWARVQCSAWFRGCLDMVEKNGCRRIGPYQYDPNLETYTKEYGTGHICRENGEQVMYESYALLQPGDGLVYFTTAGHVIMASTRAWVEREDDGTINPKKSHIIYLDQSQTWKFSVASNGEEYAHMPAIDSVMSFEELYNRSYLPITLDAFREDHQPETPWLKINLTGDTVDVDALKASKVTSNYSISDVYVIVEDGQGKEQYRKVVRAEGLFCKNLEVAGAVEEAKLASLAGSTVKILCQSGLGLREVLYSGKLK